MAKQTNGVPNLTPKEMQTLENTARIANLEKVIGDLKREIDEKDKIIEKNFNALSKSIQELDGALNEFAESMKLLIEKR